MEQLLLLVMVVFGFLVMFGVIPLKKVGSMLIGFVLILLFLPVIYGIIQQEVHSHFSQGFPWWWYIVGFFVILVIIRLFLNFLFPGRR